MKRIISILAIAALVFPVACNKEFADVIPNTPETQAELVPMSFNVSVTDTRTSLSGLHVYWQSGDQLNVIEVDGSGVLRGQHDFTYVSGEGTSSAVFSGTVVSPTNTFYAVYPNVKLYDATVGTTVIGSDIELESLGQSPVAVKDGFDPAMALMTAVADGSSFTFRHAVAYIKLATLGSEIVSVKLTSTGDARIFGRQVITLSTGAPSAVNGSSSGSNVTLSGSFVRNAEYLIPITVVPGQKLGTLKFLATNTEGETSEITTEALDIVPEAGHIYRVGMPPFNFGHVAVDLGLPSGTKWATTNVGALNPGDIGDYIAWGEVEPYYTKRDLSEWKDDKSSGYTFTSYCGSSSWTKPSVEPYEETDTADPYYRRLYPQNDFATARWGDKWCTPTLTQLEELANTAYTTWEGISKDGTSVNQPAFTAPADGCLVFKGTGTSIDKDTYIFIPADGRVGGKSVSNPANLYMWSSNVYITGTNKAQHAYMLTYVSGTLKHDNYSARRFGATIRAVVK